MHLPDGFLNAQTALVTGAVSAGAVAHALRAAGRELNERQVPLVGLTGAFIFAVQMLNFPVGLGTSGHLLGGALAAVLLGPWLACLVLAVVVLVQAIGFADGGITALGANVSLMALVAGLGAAVLFRALSAVLPPTRRAFLAATAVTAWASVVAASAVASFYLVLRGFPGEVFAVMVGLHSLIGVGEAVITTAVVSAVLSARPDLVASARRLSSAPARAAAARTRGVVLVGLGVALFAGVVLSNFADASPDGLESAVLQVVCDGDEVCLAEQAGEPVFAAAPLPDYAITPLSGLLGVLGTFAFGAGFVQLARSRRQRRRQESLVA